MRITQIKPPMRMIPKSPQSNVDQLNWSFNMDRAKREIFKNQTLNQFTEIAATTQSSNFLTKIKTIADRSPTWEDFSAYVLFDIQVLMAHDEVLLNCVDKIIFWFNFSLQNSSDESNKNYSIFTEVFMSLSCGRWSQVILFKFIN